MDGQFNSNTLSTDQDGSGLTPEYGFGSMFYSDKTSDTSSPKRRLADPEADSAGNVRSSRRAVQKHVVSVPIADADGSKMKVEAAPPSDSWAWRKYGQKPIKGSPYPRGYYRCSSWKGCPARKQVERSRLDPSMLVITYTCEHNHPWPISKTNGATSVDAKPPPPVEAAALSSPVDTEPAESFADLETDVVLQPADHFCWFSDVASPSPATDPLLESPICAGSDADDVASMVFPMREEDELLFADLGELPECSLVFRRGLYDHAEDGGRCSLRAGPFCGSTR